MKSMIVVKGPSACGKGTRVVQFIEFLRTHFTPNELTYPDGKKVRPLGLAFEELGLLFVGQYVTSNKSGLSSWSSMDAIHSALGSGDLARDMLREYTNKGYTLVCEGEPLMLSDKWRPKFLFSFYGLDTLSLIYFHYKDRAEYDARIIGRSGKAAGDSGWTRNESYPKEFSEKSRKEMLAIYNSPSDITACEKVEAYMFGERGKRSELSLLPHDASLAYVGRAILFQLEQQGKLEQLREKCLPLTPERSFEFHCKNRPMLRSVDGANPLADRVPAKADKAAAPVVVVGSKPKTQSLLNLLRR